MLLWNFSDQKLLAKAKSGTQLICVHSYKWISVSYQNLTEYDTVSNFLFSNSGDSGLVRKQKIFLEDNHKHLNLIEKKKNSLCGTHRGDSENGSHDTRSPTRI